MGRDAALLGAVIVIGLLAVGMVRWVTDNGVNALVIISGVILVVLAIGVLGALGTPPNDRR
ncbi:MAG TPA: hypothetical protein VF752_10300 [Thermoleophilaceae bacterium]